MLDNGFLFSILTTCANDTHLCKWHPSAGTLLFWRTSARFRYASHPTRSNFLAFGAKRERSGALSKHQPASLDPCPPRLPPPHTPHPTPPPHNAAVKWPSRRARKDGARTEARAARTPQPAPRPSSGSTMSNRKHRDNQEICARKVRELAQSGVNKHCFECNQPGVTYTDVTVGTFVCTSCSGML